MQDKTLKFSKDTTIISSASVVGAHEHEGPLGSFFDLHDKTDRFGKKTWEKAEGEMQRLGECRIEIKEFCLIPNCHLSVRPLLSPEHRQLG